MKIRVHIYIWGRVQGVFFRSETRKKARTLNVTGWIRNLPDGRVEAVFEGEKKDVNKLIEFCRLGPYGARVYKIKVTNLDYTGEFIGFEVTW